ncbi:MAG: SDR family NAD(P)-dependent oxidoreductase [Anaerolineales bacterium]|nr:SDR family NAD(P)-dependent oxidoreductase [Anaerolineales bacterium]
MKDKIVLITGATNGIGKQTALSLAKMNAQVFITGRNQKAEQKQLMK